MMNLLYQASGQAHEEACMPERYLMLTLVILKPQESLHPGSPEREAPEACLEDGQPPPLGGASSRELTPTAPFLTFPCSDS